MSGEVDVQGHKASVFMKDGNPCLEVYNDDRPHVRVWLPLTPADAREIAGWLVDTARAAETSEHRYAVRRYLGDAHEQVTDDDIDALYDFYRNPRTVANILRGNLRMAP